MMKYFSVTVCLSMYLSCMDFVLTKYDCHGTISQPSKAVYGRNGLQAVGSPYLLGLRRLHLKS